MEDNLNILVNGRHRQFFGKWKTSILYLFEDNRNYLLMEADFKSLVQEIQKQNQHQEKQS
jgi:hypothetical protein